MVAQYMHKPFDKSLIVLHQAQKGLDFHVHSGKSELGHSFQVLFAWSQTLSWDVMSQIVDLIPEEFALSGF